MKPNRSLRRFFSVALLGAALASLSLPLRAQTVPKGDIVVDVLNFAALPNSGSNQPARVNFLTAAPDGRIFVNDQRGPLYSVSADGVDVVLYLDVARYIPLLSDNAERGFQSFAFHPDFNTPGAVGYGKFYTMESQTDTGAAATFTPEINGIARDHDEVLLEWTALDPAAATFTPANAAKPFREVLRIARPNGNHNAGLIAFNPTAGTGPDQGNLYLGTGDSGGGGDPLTLAQAFGKAYGGILRINPLAPASGAALTSANGQYSIPADNPFTVNPGLLREKYAGGFRNPQRFVWDPANGRMFVADIGQNHVEEIDVVLPGANYGWNQREGSFVYNSNGSIGANVRGDSASTGFVYPVAEYMHFGASGNAVTAGPVYRGAGIPQLNGRLLFSDFVTGTPYTIDADNLPNGGQDGILELRLRQDGVEMSFLDMIHQFNSGATRADLRFGSDAGENIYLLDKQDGVIRRIATVETVTPPPVGGELPAVGLAVDATTISRAAGQTATITLTRTGDLSKGLTVSYVLGGEAINGEDYALRPGTKRIRAGQSSAVVRIKPLEGGGNGKVRFVVQPGERYGVDGAARKIKVFIVD